VSEYCASSSTAAGRSAGPFTWVRPSSHASGVGTGIRTVPSGVDGARAQREVGHACPSAGGARRVQQRRVGTDRTRRLDELCRGNRRHSRRSPPACRLRRSRRASHQDKGQDNNDGADVEPARRPLSATAQMTSRLKSPERAAISAQLRRLLRSGRHQENEDIDRAVPREFAEEREGIISRGCADPHRESRSGSPGALVSGCGRGGRGR
jgi:hypothetical protein